MIPDRRPRLNELQRLRTDFKPEELDAFNYTVITHSPVAHTPRIGREAKDRDDVSFAFWRYGRDGQATMDDVAKDFKTRFPEIASPKAEEPAAATPVATTAPAATSPAAAPVQLPIRPPANPPWSPSPPFGGLDAARPPTGNDDYNYWGGGGYD